MNALSTKSKNSGEILRVVTEHTNVETEQGVVDFKFIRAMVNGERDISSSIVVSDTGECPSLSVQLAIPNNPAKLSQELKEAKERAYTMQSGLAQIERMRHSLFDFDFMTGSHYHGVRWNLSRLALSHSMAINNDDTRPARFRLDRPLVIESLLPIAAKLESEEQLFGQPQQILHEGIRQAAHRAAA